MYVCTFMSTIQKFKIKKKKRRIIKNYKISIVKMYIWYAYSSSKLRHLNLNNNIYLYNVRSNVYFDCKGYRENKNFKRTEI